ncbi:hypothetical protein WKT02_04590 [Erysipelotrichaceae bacterium HCN-30851]
MSNMRISLSFRQGLNFSKCLFGKRATTYDDSVLNDSVDIAWKRTGDYLREELIDYERGKYRKSKKGLKYVTRR